LALSSPEQPTQQAPNELHGEAPFDPLPNAATADADRLRLTL